MASDDENELTQIQKEVEIVVKAPCFVRLNNAQWKKLFPGKESLKTGTSYVYMDVYAGRVRGVDISLPIRMLNYSLDIEQARFFSRLAKCYFPNLSIVAKQTDKKTLGTIALVRGEDEIEAVKEENKSENNLVPVVAPPENDWESIKKGFQNLVTVICTEFLKMGVCVECKCVLNPPGKEITLHPCGWCYEKLAYVLQFEPRKRSQVLGDFYSLDEKFAGEATWERNLIRIIEEKLEGESAKSANKRRRSEVARYGYVKDAEDKEASGKPAKKPRSEMETDIVDGAQLEEETDPSGRLSARRGRPANTKSASSASKSSATPKEYGTEKSSTPGAAHILPKKPSSTETVNDAEETLVLSTRQPVNGRGSVEVNEHDDGSTGQKWQNAYCLIQYLATLRADVDEDFNEASIMSDVKRHSMRQK
ncbi:hypothetical protein SeMB42_g05221 [Synchytrium endobioticum]|uniref:Uncharacterized protein n=1 Tax=Synchytrium endobioticum TaxID=286115 RepID=A0A507CT27_9FUNG|nr:hypothetical protein SeMB42_g05221 [Synchytrium endobioticum]